MKSLILAVGGMLMILAGSLMRDEPEMRPGLIVGGLMLTIMALAELFRRDPNQ